MKRVDAVLRWLPIATGFLLLVALAVRPIQDHDVWWHLQTGKYVLEHGLPDRDVLTHTATDRRWVVPDWACDILLYGVHRAAGPAGLTLLKLAGFAGAFLILVRIGRLRGASPVAIGIALTMAVLVARMRFLERPLVFKFLFSALWVWGMESYRLGGRRWFWWLVPAQAVWVNFHSSFIVGPAIPLAYAGALWIEGTVLRREGTRSPWPCAAFAGACLVASLADPRGPSTLLYPFTLASTVVMRAAVDELAPLSFLHFAEHPAWAWCLVAMLATWVVTWLLEARRAPLCDLFVALPFLWLGVNSVRFLGLWSLFAAPAVALNAGACGRRVGGSGAWRLAALLPTAAVAALYAWPRGLPAPDLRLGVDARALPVYAVEYLNRRGIRGNAFNSFELGGMIEWACWPRVKTFIDGRGMVFGDELVAEFMRLQEGGPKLADALDRHSVTVAVLSTAAWRPTTPYRRLFPAPEWRLVHWDDLACVYVRDASAHRDDVYEVFDPSEDNTSYVADDRLDALARDVERCLARVPDCGRARFVRALIAKRRGDVDAAASDLEEVVRIWPSFGAAWFHLGAARMAQGRFEEARRHLDRARALGGDDEHLREMLRRLDEAGY